MPKAAKTTDIGRVPFQKPSDSDILLFLTRTLQPHFSDAETQGVFEKLQALKDALDQHEITLVGMPDSPDKDRICATCTNAQSLVAQIVSDFAAASRKQPTIRDADPA